MHRKTTAVTQIRISEGAWAVTGAAHTNNVYIFVFYCYIRVLLIKLSSMIYCMSYKICRKGCLPSERTSSLWDTMTMRRWRLPNLWFGEVTRMGLRGKKRSA